MWSKTDNTCLLTSSMAVNILMLLTRIFSWKHQVRMCSYLPGMWKREPAVWQSLFLQMVHQDICLQLWKLELVGRFSVVGHSDCSPVLTGRWKHPSAGWKWKYNKDNVFLCKFLIKEALIRKIKDINHKVRA